MKPTDPPSPQPPPTATAGQAPPSPQPPPTATAGHGPGPNFPYDEMHNDDVAHEHSDIDVRAIVTSAVVVAVVCLGTAALVAVLFNALEDQAAARDPKMSPLAMPATTMPPNTLGSPEFGGAPLPRLLTNEPRTLRQIRDQEHTQLSGYGWVDQSAGVARIPIEEAKKLIVERGLPIRPDPVADSRLGTQVPTLGESSSGRTITRPPAATEPAVAPSQPPAAQPAPPAHKDH
jgi:hypothetical protein